MKQARDQEIRQQTVGGRRRSRTVWLLLLGAGLLAKPAAGQSINLNQAIEQGTQAYPFLKSKQAEIQSAEKRLQSGRTEFLPSIIVQDQYTYGTSNGLNGSFFPNEGAAMGTSGGIRPENIYRGTTGSFASAIIDWRIVNFGRVKASVKAAEADLNRSQTDYENEIFQHQIRIIDAYLTLLVNQKLVDVQRANLQRAQTFKKVIDAGVSSGMRAGVDSSLATAEAVRARLQLLESEQREQVQRLRLSELMGQVQPGMRIDSMRFYTTLPQTTFQSDSISPKNPVLRLFQSQINLSSARSTALQRSMLPSVSLVGGGWARGSGFTNADDTFSMNFNQGLGYQSYNYLFGVVARWNLTNTLRLKHDYRAEQFQVERFRQLYNDQQLRITRQNREAETQLLLGLEQARQAPVQLRAARQAYNQAQARYQNGLADLPTLLQSFVTLNRAEIDGYVATSNVWRFLLLKAAAEGDLSIFMNQIK
ncbi:TolC family protein [Larkinella bovis]|uniref:TolC family protein n=1 Tax=Larkinella bovis TaxID=683041 RepID=A0ABW0IHV0_9BACT